MYPDATWRAENLAMRLFPPGTKLSKLKLGDVRKAIVIETKYLFQIQDELEQLKMDKKKQEVFQ